MRKIILVFLVGSLLFFAACAQPQEEAEPVLEPPAEVEPAPEPEPVAEPVDEVEPMFEVAPIPTEEPQITSETEEPPAIEAPKTLVQYKFSSQYGAKLIYGKYWAGQVFTAPVDGTAETVVLRVWRVGDSAPLIVSINPFSEGTVGEALATVTVETANFAVKDPGKIEEFALSAQLVSGSEYIVVVMVDGGDEQSNVRWVFNTDGGGNYYYSNDAGGEWYQFANRDFVLEVRIK